MKHLVTLRLLCTLLALSLVTPKSLAQGSARDRLDAAIKNANNQPPTGGVPQAIKVPVQKPPSVAPTLNSAKSAEASDAATPAEVAEFMESAPDLADLEENKPLTLRDQAFKQMLDKISPLTPDQIIEMRKQQDQTQRAVATFPTTPPRPVSSTLTVDLSPGATPPVIRLGSGFVTSLVFVDSTGQSWPIADYSLGNPKNFNIQWDKKTNTLFIQSTTTYNSGNMAIRLAKLDTPLMISLVSGQKEIDYRVDLQVPGRGPNALALITGDNLPSHPAPILLSVLDGVPPPGSQELVVSGGCGRAWIWKGRLIFRTQMTILSPAWTATVSSIDGTHVYEMNPTPLILGMQNGKTIKIHLTGI